MKLAGFGASNKVKNHCAKKISELIVKQISLIFELKCFMPKRKHEKTKTLITEV